MNNIMNTKIRKAYNSYFLNKINKKINETTNYKTELTYSKTDERCSSVPTPTRVGCKTELTSGKTSRQSLDVSVPTKVGRITIVKYVFILLNYDLIK